MIRPTPEIVTNFRTRDSKDWQPLHIYIQPKMKLTKLARNQTTRKLAA